jgi:hypothetical protein
MFSDIQKIKQVSLDRNIGKGDNVFLIKSQQIVDRIINQYKNRRIDIFDLLPKNNMFSNSNTFVYDKYDLDRKMPIIFYLCTKVFKGEKDIDSKKNTTYNLLTLAEKFMGIEYYVYLIKSKAIENQEYKFLQNFNIIKNYFNNLEGQFNNFFFNDLRVKINNMLYYAILKMKNNNNNFNSYNNLYGINRRNPIYHINNYDNYYNNNYMNNNNYINANNSNLKTPDEILKGEFSLNLDLKDLYKNTKIDTESLNLLRTLGTKWYKCPNGHLYVVGECGGPMQQSICPECKRAIGGRNHIPENQNRAVDLNAAIMNINFSNNNIIGSHLLNQDQEAQNNMNQQHNINQEHHMDDDIRDLINRNPEMNNYFNNQ